MELFGPFEATREIDSASGSTVFRARKEGDPKGDYVVKLFSLERLVAEEQGETKSELDPLFKDIGRSFTNRVNLQKKAAEGSRYFVPILAGGHDGRGGWYATNFYARSVKGMLDRFVVLEARDLFHLVQSLVQAALYLKKTFGRSHGNLKPSNTFIDGLGKPRDSRVVVSDLLPSEAANAAAYELADLRAIGEMIYQLVLRHKVDFSTGWVILPVEASREWLEMFGKNTPAWLDLCNKLLDPQLSLDRYGLEKLAADLAGLKPKLPVTIIILPVAAVLILLVAAGFHVLHRKANYGTIIAGTDPPGSRLIVVPVVDGFEDRDHSRTNVTVPNGTPLKFVLKKGEYMLRATHEDLDPRRAKVTVTGGQTVVTNLNFAYGGLVVLSDPPGARFTVGGKEALTPYTNPIVKPAPVSFQLNYEADGLNYVPVQVQGEVQSNKAVVLSAKLIPPKAGEEVVEFTSDPPGAEIFIDGKVTLKTSADSRGRTTLPDGSYRITAQLNGWAAKEKTLAVSTRKGRTPVQAFYFEHGTLDVAAGDPAVNIFVNGELAGVSPAKIYLPSGRFNLAFSAEGYETNRVSVTVADKGRYPFKPVLKALAGFIEVATDPPGAEIRDQYDKVLGVTGADGLARIALPPGVYNLKATLDGLKPVEQKNVEVKAGQPREVPLFKLDYGTVIFTEIQPPDARAAANILGADRRIVKMGEPILQRTDGVVTYRIEASNYQSWATNVTVASRQTQKIAVKLLRLTMPVKLVCDPPGADFYINGDKLDPAAGPEYALPWGPAELVVRYPRLGAVTNLIEVKLGVTNTIPPFNFTYGTVILTNLPEDVVIKVGDEELVRLLEPMRRACDKPGLNTYDLYLGGQKADSITTNLAAGGSIVLNSEISRREFRNGIGLPMVRVQNLFGTGKDGWVGKTEVTQAEYEQVMGSGANPSKYTGRDLPVQNVSWLKAAEFCEKLTLMDTRHPPGPSGRYSLPTLDQWKMFGEGADLKTAVYGGTQPARVGSKGPSNKYGVSDVLGNVREWLAGGDPKNKDFIGGGFRSRPSFGGMASFLNPQQIQLDQASDDLGFRVIWVPNQ